ncbi:calcium-binding protein [Actinoplanes sp. NBRC 101535]|uniref:calcium-binding protein n=1 Tax=Actinoplanes sp. NBRC 101535 TaxID=3032196 RepID=UPI0024A523AE|nr:calcium-binding protein [Actinoplanes sp. NBRC 101535]GLY05181.1 hypothetical protein Acsp01_55600 [Actinoplanes sp. NBRC 101535]
MSLSPWFARTGITLLATASVGALSVAPAQAASTGTAKSNGVTVSFTAGAGKANKVVITRSGSTVTIDDRVRIKPGKDCKAVKGDSTKVKCKIKVSEFNRLMVKLGDRDDSVVNDTAIPMTALGGTGKDRLIGGSNADWFLGDSGRDYLDGRGGSDNLAGNTGDDEIHGGAGNDSLDGDSGADRLYGEAGNDSVQGGTGKDRLWGGAGDDNLDGATGADLINGGAGRDTVNYLGRTKPVTVDLDGQTGDDGEAGEKDTVGADVEDILGGSGADRLTGNAANNRIQGWYGDDVIRGGGGNDVLLGENGRDRIYGDAGDDQLDGTTVHGADVPDTLDGGAGQDTCVVRPEDTQGNCER